MMLRTIRVVVLVSFFPGRLFAVDAQQGSPILKPPILADAIRPALIPVLAEMRKLGPPMEFQTENWKGNFDQEVKDAKSDGATEFEMWDTKDTGKGVPVGDAQIKGWMCAVS